VQNGIFTEISKTRVKIMWSAHSAYTGISIYTKPTSGKGKRNLRVQNLATPRIVCTSPEKSPQQS